MWPRISLVPRPSPKSGKRVWCSERQFLSHGAGPYFVKNVIIAFLYPEFKFLTPQSIWTTIQPGLQKLETTAKTGCETSFCYFRFVSKYDRLRHAIIIRSSAIWLVISNPRSAPPHVTRNVAQNTRRVSAKPGLWTVEWTVDWTVDWTMDWTVDWTVDYVLYERCASVNWSDEAMASIYGEVSASPPCNRDILYLRFWAKWPRDTRERSS